MNINSSELLLLSKKIKLAKEQEKPVANTENTVGTTNPQTGMNALMFMGLKNITSDPNLASELKVMNETVPVSNKSEDETKDYVAPYKSNIAFQGKASKLKSVAMATVLGLASLGAVSCDDKEYILLPPSTETNVTVNVDLSAVTELFAQMQAIWQQMLEQQQITNEQLQQNNELMKQLIELYIEGSTNAQEFYSQMYDFIESSTENQKVIIEILTQNGMTQEEANELLKTLIAEVQSGKISAAEAMQKIIELLGDINIKLDGVFEKINDIFENNLELKDDVKSALDRIEKLVAEGNAKIDVTNKLLNELIAMYENGALSEENFQKLLDAISKNGDKIDVTNELLTQIKNQDKQLQEEILNYISSIGLDVISNLNNILKEIGNNSNKLSEVTQLLAKIQYENEQFQKNILNTIDKLGVDITKALTNIVIAIENGNDTVSKNIEALLDKVLAKLDTMDANQQESAKAIIDAIANINVGEGGNIDISSLEKMMAELIELTAKNNSLLESIDGKLDLIQLSIDAAKDEILSLLSNEFDKNDERYKNIMNTLNEIKINAGSGSYDDTELLQKLDSILVLLDKIGNKEYDDTELMEKLDKILEAIKDHNITIDITGKVECNCNCGGNHEGILGDLEDILS